MALNFQAVVLHALLDRAHSEMTCPGPSQQALLCHTAMAVHAGEAEPDQPAI